MVFVASCVVAGIAIVTLPVLGVIFADKQTFKCPYNSQSTNTHRTGRVYDNNKGLFYSVLLVAIVGMSFDATVIGLICS